MSEIKRADFTPYGMVEKEEGHYVYFADHEAEIARLRAEVEKNRVDAERYRWLRDTPWMHNYDLRGVIQNQMNGLWDERIDAAMGEGK